VRRPGWLRRSIRGRWPNGLRCVQLDILRRRRTGKRQRQRRDREK